MLSPPRVTSTLSHFQGPLGLDGKPVSDNKDISRGPRAGCVWPLQPM